MTKLLVTDGWEAAKNLFVSLWRRVHPERADRVGADLAQARDDLLASPQADVPQLEAGLADEWQGRLRSLLAANPWLASELRRILDTEFRPALAESNGGVAPVITMHARVDGGGSIYQAGRDQHIGRDLRRDSAARCPPVRPVGRDHGRFAPGGTSIRWW